jgi:type IV pilus assembly protein PilQ
MMRQMKLATPAAALPILAVLACVGSIVLSAGPAPPIRLVGVSAQGNALLIEATEPMAYAVSRPDPLTVVLELRDVSVGDAESLVETRDPIAGVSLEQGIAADGKSVARVRVSLSRPAEPKVRSARNTIRLELTPAVARATATAAGPSSRPVMPRAQMPPDPTGERAATMLERVRASSRGHAATVTLSGNGLLTPASVTESPDRPRRLVLDFPEVASRAPADTSVDSPLVTRVRVAANSREPRATRVVMEIADAATYHVERAGTAGRDLAVVFEPPRAGGTVMLALPSPGDPADAEPDVIPLPEAIANAAPLTPRDVVGTDPMAALKVAAVTAAEAERAAANAARVQQPPTAARVQQPPTAAPPAQTPPAQTPPAQPPAPQPPAPPPVVVPPPPSSPGSQVFTAEQKTYRGTPITLDFAGVDLRSVLRVFSEPSGLNIIIDPAVPATPVDILLRDIPWDQALEIILRTHQLGYEVEGTVIRIAPLKVLEDEQRQRSTLAAAKALAGDLVVQTFPLSYARAELMSPLLVKSALSQRGQIQVDTRTNTLIITDLPDRLQTASNLIGALDRPEPQVEVEARIVQTTRDFARAIGIQWGLNGRMMPDTGNTTNLAFPNRGTLGGRTGGENAPIDPRAGALETTANAVNLGVPAASSAIGLALGAVNGAFNLDIALSALERSGKGRVLSTPRLTTQNNVAAEVAQGVQIPIQTVANNTVTVTFKEAVLILQVTPQITAAGTVIMQVTIENASADFSRQVNGIPPIDTQRAKTQVQVDDGATTVIGGIFVSREQVSSDRTPLLHRIPLLGWLFRRESTSDESRELLIFLTPRILKG